MTSSLPAHLTPADRQKNKISYELQGGRMPLTLLCHEGLITVIECLARRI